MGVGEETRQRFRVSIISFESSEWGVAGCFALVNLPHLSAGPLWPARAAHVVASVASVNERSSASNPFVP